MPPQQQKVQAKSIMVKPQITKEYVNSQTMGKPDFTALEDKFELGDKFYEPQYSIVQNAHRETWCMDEQIEKADV